MRQNACATADFHKFPILRQYLYLYLYLSFSVVFWGPSLALSQPALNLSKHSKYLVSTNKLLKIALVY